MRNKKISPALFVVLLWGAGMCTPAAHAQAKKDLYSAAEAAAAGGNIEEAQKGYCKVAKLHPKNKDAKLLCNVITEKLEREGKKNDKTLHQSMKEFNNGKIYQPPQQIR